MTLSDPLQVIPAAENQSLHAVSCQNDQTRETSVKMWYTHIVLVSYFEPLCAAVLNGLPLAKS